MTICPIALTAGCKKCPIYAVCLVKGVVGDQQKTKDDSSTATGKSKGK